MPTLDEYLVRWKDNDNNVRDLGITKHEDGDYRLSIKEHVNIVPVSGIANGVIIGGDANIINQTQVGTAAYIRRISVTGSTDALVELFIDGNLYDFMKITSIDRCPSIDLGSSHFYAPIGSVVTLKVTNMGIQTGDFKGVILKEVNL